VRESEISSTMANSDELAMMDKANTDEARLRKTSRRLYCLPQGRAVCYPRSVNRNIFYIIGVVVVIVIVLKLLHVF